MYNLHQAKSDIENMDVQEIEWFYGRLVQEKRDEAKAIEEARSGRKTIEVV